MPSLLDLFVNVRTTGTGTVGAELAGISSQAAKTDKAVGSSMRSIGSSMSRVGRGMSLFVTAPIALAGAAMVKMGADFDQALTNAVSVTGKTGKAADAAKRQMNDLALTLGAKTAFSAKDAADAMYDLASSGWSVNDMQKGLNGIMALAAATQTDLADATGTVTSTLAAFKLESQDSGHVSDVFTAAINKSRLQMDDLSQGMKYVGPVAAGFGLSLEETTAALAEMADAGIEGSQAGTTLRAALSALANPVGQGADALHALGVSFDSVNPKTHSLAEIMGTLKAAGMDTNDAIKIFGREASAGMIAVADQGAPALQKLTKELENSGGTAERTAKMQLNTLAGAWQNLSGSLETAAIRFEQQIEPALIAITNALVPVVNWISKLPAPIKAVILGIAAFAAVLGPLILVGGLVASAIGGIAAVLGLFGLTVGTALLAVIPIVAAFAGLAAVGIVLYKHWKGVGPVFNTLRGIFSRVVGVVKNLFTVFKGLITGNEGAPAVHRAFAALPHPVQQFVIAVLNLWRNFKTKVLPVLQQVASVIRGALVTAFRFVQKQVAYVVKWFVNNWPLIRKVGVGVIDGFVKLVKGIIGGLVVFWRLNHKEIIAIVKAAWDVIKTIVRTAIHIVLDVIKLAMQLLSGDWKGAWNTIKDILKTLWDAMVRLVKDSLTIFKNIIKAGWNVAKALTKQTWEDIKTMLGNAWDGIKSGAKAAWEAISEAIYNPIEDAYNKIVDFVNKIITVVNSVLKAFGKDPITLVSHGGGPSTPNPGQERMNLQTGRHGDVRAFGRGGIARRTGLVGETGDPEAVVNLKRRTPESQMALRAALRSPNARSHISGVGEALGPTRYDLVPSVRAKAEGITHDIPDTSWNTYVGHGLPGGSTEDYTFDVWGGGGRGDPIATSAGYKAADLALGKYNDGNPALLYMIRQGQYWRGGNWKPWPQDPHYDHTHISYVSPHGTAGGAGGGTGPSLAELIWNKLSGLLPSVPSFGGGVVGSAASAYLNGYKDWIHSWLLSKFGGGAPGGKSPSGLTIGQALSKGGWPSSELEHASAIVWRESGGNARAQNPSGARGLMQIMPQTAKGIGYDYNRLYDPVYNTSGGHKLWSQQGYSPWVTEAGWQSSTGHQNDPVTGYDYGGLIKRDHLAKVHANELYMPLDRPHVERTAQTALGTAELRSEIADLRQALTDGGIRVKDYAPAATEVIIAGAHHGGLRAMRSKEGKAQTIATVKEKNIKRELSGLRQGGW